MNTIKPFESALAVLIPEAEALVEPFRQQYDPSAATGVPAHVTILYPFKPPDDLTGDVIQILRDLFNELPAFTVSFNKIMHFPDAIFLAPEPAEPFRQMTRLVADRFPETPPYRGEFNEIVPHLTVAQESDPQKLAGIAADFKQAALNQLPISARINKVSLLVNSSGYWQVRAEFHLH